MRVLQSSLIGALSPIFQKLNGMPGVPDTAPSVSCLRLAGTVLPAPDVVEETELQGRYYAKLLPLIHTDQLDRLTLEWDAVIDGETTNAKQYVWVVDGMLVTPAQLYGEPDMNSKPPWLLTMVCDAINDYCESYCNKAFGSKIDQEAILWAQARGGRYPLRWGRVQSLISAVGDDIDVLDRLQLLGSVLWTQGRSWPWENTLVTYQHGEPWGNERLHWEALQAARQDVLSRSARMPRQTISETTAGTVVRFSTPDIGMARPTGYLTLDPVLENERLPIGFA
jgi:hypothetical protein